MAISYGLSLSTGLSVEQVAREATLIGQRLGLYLPDLDPEQLVSSGATTTRNSWSRIRPTHPEPWQPEITELGITTRVRIVFRLDTDDQLLEQEDDFIAMVGQILVRIPGDAIMSGLDVIWLVRKNGVLDVNEADDFWTPERLALLPRPYNRRTYTFE